MVIKNGPGTVSSNLRFAWDIADTRNSYIGEPTTNLYGAESLDIPSYWTRGSNFTYLGSTPYGPVVNGIQMTAYRYRSESPSFSYLNKIVSVSPNTMYTISVYIKMEYGTSTQNNGVLYSADFNAGIPASSNITSDWKRIYYTFTSGPNTTSANIVLFGYDNGAGNILQYSCPQLEAKSHATQFVAGVRSVTNSLFDVSGYGASLDMSNMSFDTNANPTFDGSNDYIPVAHANSPITNKSYEIVFKPTSIPASNSYRSIWQKSGNWNGDTGISMQFIYNNFTFSYGASWGGSVALAPIANYVTVNNWYHVVGTVSGNGGTATMYINGSVAGTGTAGTPTTTDNLNIGLGNGGSLLGDMPIFRMYSETLSAAQVQQNYLAYKKRFGI